MSGSALIDIHKLSKRYGSSDTYAVHNLTLSVAAGEVYGFLGPNGAGKSTTIRTLLNLLQPSGGSARILGMHIVKDSVALKHRIGYLSGDMAMYPKMTAAQYLDYMGSLQPPASAAYRQELCKRLECNLRKPLGELSRGNRQKIALVQAFMSKPDVLILDEPTSGLDPLMQEVFYDLLDEARERKASVFMSSHLLAEVQKTCDRVGIIRAGKLIAERDIADMTAQAAQTFIVRFAQTLPLAQLKKLNGLNVLAHEGNEIRFRMDGELKPLFALLASSDVLAVETQQLDLEDMFMHYYEATS